MNGLIVLMAIFAVASKGSALQCHQCGPDLLQQIQNTGNDADCLVSTSNYGPLKECSGPLSACAKGTLEVGSNTIQVRMCQENLASLAGECQDTSGPHILGKQMTICACNDKDGCNSATRSIQTSFFALMMMCALPLLTMTSI